MYGQGRRNGTKRRKECCQGAGDGPWRVQILEERHCTWLHQENFCKETPEKWFIIGRKTHKYQKKQEKKAQNNVLIRLATGKSKKIKIGKMYPKARKYGDIP